MKLKKLAALGLVGAVVLAACGSDDNGSSGGTTKETAAPAPPATAAPAPSTAAEEATTIRLWLNGEDTKHELVDYAIAEFKKLHPDVDVKFERQQWTGIVEKLTTALSQQRQPGRGRARQHAGPGLRGRRRAAGPHRQEGGARRRRPAAEPGRGRDVRRQVLRRAVLRRRSRRRVPQGPVREVGLAIPTTIDEFIAGRHQAEGRQRRRRRTSRASTSRASTGSPRCRSSGRPAATSPCRTATSGRACWPPTSRSKGLDAGQDDHGPGLRRAEGRRRVEGLHRLLQR